MPVQRPTSNELEAAAETWQLSLASDDMTQLQDALETIFRTYERVERLAPPPQPSRPRQYRVNGRRPPQRENPLNAWQWKGDINGAESGRLAGKTVAIKDNIAVAGVPMTCGSKILESYVPEMDATVVARVLDAGARIAGKATCENLCLSASSFTSVMGPVLNPYDSTRSTGGSSSGCAALVAHGDVDLAIGTDQGGSVRAPSSWCGICGLKPTFGLVPYTGIMPLELTLDVAGPMTRTVEMAAELLDVMAGADGLDPRQRGVSRAESYVTGLDGRLIGWRIGLVREGFGWSGISERDVDTAVRDACRAFVDIGCEVAEASVPWHRHAVDIYGPIFLEGLTTLMGHGSTNWNGLSLVGAQDAFTSGRHAAPDGLPLTAKVRMIAGAYLAKTYSGHFYAHAQNLVRELTRQYDEAFSHFDLLAMPTVPVKARTLPRAEMTADQYMRASSGISQNTCASNLTGHPSITVPCGMSGGLPIGLMLVAPLHADARLLQAAHSFQESIYRPPSPPGTEYECRA